MRMPRPVLTLLLALAGAPAVACPDAPPPAEYEIRHERHGEVGRHVITFICEDDRLIVETAIEGEVRVLTVPIFQRKARYREVWQNDRLLAFDSRVVDNGEVYEVTARADGARTVIHGRRGRIEAPATVVSNHPWNLAVIARPLLFDTQRGRLQRVQVRPAGETTIVVGSRAVRAQKYVVTGDLERELWYAEDGAWLQSRLEYQGAAITLTRVR